jgi:hypothetical protein
MTKVVSWIPVSSTGMTREGGAGITRKESAGMTEKGGAGMRPFFFLDASLYLL